MSTISASSTQQLAEFFEQQAKLYQQQANLLRGVVANTIVEPTKKKREKKNKEKKEKPKEPRALSALNVYVREQMKLFKVTNPGESQKAAMTSVSLSWSKLTPAQKSKYVLEAEKINIAAKELRASTAGLKPVEGNVTAQTAVDSVPSSSTDASSKKRAHEGEDESKKDKHKKEKKDKKKHKHESD